jgi:hypothetical protein
MEARGRRFCLHHRQNWAAKLHGSPNGQHATSNRLRCSVSWTDYIVSARSAPVAPRNRTRKLNAAMIRWALSVIVGFLAYIGTIALIAASIHIAIRAKHASGRRRNNV